MLKKISKMTLMVALAGSSVAWAAHHGKHQGHGAMKAPATDTTEMPVAKGVSAQGCWVRLLPAPAPSAGYFVLENDTASEVSLVGAAAPQDYGLLMVHQTRHENGMSRMAMIDEVPVPANGKLEFKPGGYHIMLEQPRRDVAVGETIQVDLVLKSGEKVVASCEVKPAGSMPGQVRMRH
ncbi:MAG: copper chaperone PCu(A)C [Pusillimonas sp.]